MADYRNGLLKDIIKLFRADKLPTSIESKNMERDYKWFNNNIRRENLSESVGMSRERDKNLLWFYKRRPKN